MSDTQTSSQRAGAPGVSAAPMRFEVPAGSSSPRRVLRLRSNEERDDDDDAGSLQGILLIVEDIEAARDELISHGVDVTQI